jgi:hypothetical protein
MMGIVLTKVEDGCIKLCKIDGTPINVSYFWKLKEKIDPEIWAEIHKITCH